MDKNKEQEASCKNEEVSLDFAIKYIKSAYITCIESLFNKEKKCKFYIAIINSVLRPLLIVLAILFIIPDSPPTVANVLDGGQDPLQLYGLEGYFITFWLMFTASISFRAFSLRIFDIAKNDKNRRRDNTNNEIKCIFCAFHGIVFILVSFLLISENILFGVAISAIVILEGFVFLVKDDISLIYSSIYNAMSHYDDDDFLSCLASNLLDSGNAEDNDIGLKLYADDLYFLKEGDKETDLDECIELWSDLKSLSKEILDKVS